MSAGWIAVAGGLIVLFFVLGLAVWMMWRHGDSEGRALVKRIARLRLPDKVRLAVALARDSRIPLAVRAIPPGLIVYLATPIDLIPDFIPVVGHIDDLVIVLVGVGLLLRFTPRNVLEEQIGRLELAQLPNGSSKEGGA